MQVNEGRADKGEQNREMQKVDAEGQTSEVTTWIAFEQAPYAGAHHHTEIQRDRAELALELIQVRCEGQLTVAQPQTQRFDRAPILGGA